MPDKTGRNRIYNTKVCVSFASYAVTSPKRDRNDPKRNRAPDLSRTNLPVMVS
jgi:hypothetical protein